MGETSSLLPEWKATADEIWAVLRETDRIIKDSSKESAQRQKEIDRRFQEIAEQQKETDRRFQETDQIIKKLSKETAQRHKETERIIQELSKETAEQHKETERIIQNISKELGGVSNRLGEVAQCFFGSELWKHFEGFEYEFQQLYPYLPLFDEHNKPLGDIDITLLNGEYAMAIEVKTHLKKKNVEYHAKRMEQIQQYPPAQYQGRKALAGLAALMVDRDAKDLADELGMYVIEQSGEAVRLAPRPGWFKACEW
ncbi:MAG: hypothetical protein LBC51_02740 [Treponema sp.]|jgi:DNA repair exonuclease SbcCD ATPase subunit|nr:hypothetical protein [Treponema sp.]